MSNVLPGRLIGVKIGGQYFKCQTNADLTLTGATTADETCKPDQGVEGNPIGWVTRTVDSKDWTITFSAKNFADGLGNSGYDMSRIFIDTDLSVTAFFMTNPDQGSGDFISADWVYEGEGLLTSLKINAPEKGSSTYDATIEGNGPLTLTEVNRVS